MLLTLISIIGTSCGTSAYVGEWTLFSAEDADGNLYAGGYAFETAELTLRDDGSGFLVLARDGKESEESTTIAWEEHDKEIELTGDDIA